MSLYFNLHIYALPIISRTFELTKLESTSLSPFSSLAILILPKKNHQLLLCTFSVLPASCVDGGDPTDRPETAKEVTEEVIEADKCI